MKLFRKEDIKYFCEELKVGQGITWHYGNLCRNKTPYEIIKVINQNHIIMQEYKVVKDYKTKQLKLKVDTRGEIAELKKVHGIWYKVWTYSKEHWYNVAKRLGGKDETLVLEYFRGIKCLYMDCLTKSQQKKVEKGGTIKKYQKIYCLWLGVAIYEEELNGEYVIVKKEDVK
jgi:hypothetical protein